MSTDLSLADGWLPERPESVAWEMATMLPEQGRWTPEQYFEATEGSNRRVEYVDGRLEFLPMPTGVHQALAGFLYHALLAFNVDAKRGIVPFPPIRVWVTPHRVREPDVLFLLEANSQRQHNRAWDGADLVVEVVSGSAKDRIRDYQDKLLDYALIGVSEYWIVDPDERHVIVHRLDGDKYVEHGKHREGDVAASALLDGFTVDITALFAVADAVPE